MTMMSDALSPASAPSVLAFVPPERAASTHWRQLWPLHALNERGYRVDAVVADPATTAWLDAAAGWDMVIVPRLQLPAASLADVRTYFESLRRTGAVIVGDYDDHLWLSDADARSWFVSAVETPLGFAVSGPAAPLLPQTDRLATLRLLDAVTVSTTALAAVVRGLTDAPVAVVPNLLPLDWFRATVGAIPRLVPPLTIGWAGAARNGADLAPLLAAWRRLAGRFPAVTFVTFGDWLPGFADLPRDRHVHIPRTDLDRYPVGFGSIDIGCAAVDTHPASLCRSVNKVVEHGAAGAAVVASHDLYGEVIRDGEDGLLATSADEWEAALARLIEDAALRARLAAALGATVERDWSLDRNASRWPRAWADLRAAVLARRGAATGARATP